MKKELKELFKIFPFPPLETLKSETLNLIQGVSEHSLLTSSTGEVRGGTTPTYPSEGRGVLLIRLHNRKLIASKEKPSPDQSSPLDK